MNPAPIDEVVDLLRALRLPHMRAAAPKLLATAKAQRWESDIPDQRQQLCFTEPNDGTSWIKLQGLADFTTRRRRAQTIWNGCRASRRRCRGRLA